MNIDFNSITEKTTLIKMYFNNTAKSGKNFNAFIEAGFAGKTSCSTV